MEKFYLENPTIERKEQALEYLQEHIDFNSHINGVGGLHKCLDKITYEEWLEKLENDKNEKYVINKGFVPNSTYFMCRESDDKIIGMFNLRHYLNEDLKKGGGHIGYGI